jgi:ABC-type dipeptide/oligopeptide/nickel transport system permease component
LGRHLLQIKIAFERGGCPFRQATARRRHANDFLRLILLTLNPNALQLSLKYLALPALCLSFGALATVARTVRADALEVRLIIFVPRAPREFLKRPGSKYTLKNA